MTSDTIKAALQQVAVIMNENSGMLSQLDAAMGDGDLGIYMKRGFERAYMAVEAMQDIPGVILKTAGNCIMEEAPSTLGTLMGLFIRSMARPIKGQETFSFTDFLEMFQAGYDEIVKRGKAALGEKTILDTLHPSLCAMRKAHAAGKTPLECLTLGYNAAQEGLLKSTAMRAVHGRPAYFGDKTIGMQDGGATVGALFMESLVRYAALTEQPTSSAARYQMPRSFDAPAKANHL